MSEDQFKTRLKIAKNKVKSRKSSKSLRQSSSSSIGIAAFKMSTELVSAVRGWDNYWVYFRQLVWY